MLFNSYSFLLAFLPVTLVGFFLFSRLGKVSGASWLAACSLFFYAWWDSRYIVVLLASICGNYLAGSWIARRAGTASGRRALVSAVASNLLLLAYFKYTDFFLGSINSALGTEWPILGIVLPIGISFFTFTQIAFLADAYAGKVTEYRFTYYVLFVSYFPHLIAGPVLHHREMMPQFDEDKNYRPSPENISIGLTIFAIGLAKKVLIADNLAAYAGPAFTPLSEPLTMFHAWGGVLAYTFQLYFDFSGYSDMAIGLSRLFGIRLPLNFNSPYKSPNISEFWRRWHMTLSRFLRDYLYIPLGGNRCGAVRRQLNLLATMVLGGLWHGAGWTFVIWGALHGVFLVINHLWQRFSPRIPLRVPPKLAHVLGTAVTFSCVVVAWVYFRAPDLATANRLLVSMVGGWGVAVPESILSHLGPLRAILEEIGVRSSLGGGAVLAETWLWVAVAALIAFLAPNTQQIMARFSPALAVENSDDNTGTKGWVFLPCRRQAIAIAVLFAFGILAISRPTEFLYFQF